jgi:glycosyltransferase involved in cell wall biosynthesis
MITILIRTSNRPQQFKRCIDSVINQTYKDWKVIVCIDGDDYVPNMKKYLNLKH